MQIIPGLRRRREKPLRLCVDLEFRGWLDETGRCSLMEQKTASPILLHLPLPIRLTSCLLVTFCGIHFQKWKANRHLWCKSQAITQGGVASSINTSELLCSQPTQQCQGHWAASTLIVRQKFQHVIGDHVGRSLQWWEERINQNCLC